MRGLLIELDAENIEPSDVSLTHESQWSLGAYPGGLRTWDNVRRPNLDLTYGRLPRGP